MLKGKEFFSLIAFACIMQISRAQFDTQSPYSYYGIGNPVGSTLQNGFAMGGVYNSLRDSVYVNYLNPASYSSIDVTQLIFGFEGNFLTRTVDGQSYHNNNLFINQFGLAIPVMHKHKFVNWGMFFGYGPYSQVGYRLAESAQITMYPDTTLMTANYNYIGTGGINKLTFGNGFQLGKHFSVGINLHYLFGTSSRIRTLDLPASSGYLSSRVEEKTRVSTVTFDVGAQSYFYFKVKKLLTPRKITIVKRDLKTDSVISKRDSIVSGKIRRAGPLTYKNYQLVFGGTYNYGNSFSAGFEQLGIQYIAGSFNVGVDTFLLNPNGTGNITMPHAFGGGVSLINPGIWMVSADFNYKLWNNFRYFDQPDLVFNNSYSLHLGMQYTPYFSDKDKYDSKGRFFKSIAYRFGVRYYNRFFRPDSKPVDEMGFSFGLGLPFGFRKSFDEDLNKKIIISYINLGIEGGFANSRGGGAVNESFVRFTVAVTLRDKWFVKLRYN